MELMEIFTSNKIFGTSCYHVRKTIQMMSVSNSCPEPTLPLHLDL